MTGRAIFLSYADGAFAAARDALCQSADAAGFDEVLARDPDDLPPDFVAGNSQILSQSRGAGYWLWKPRIILQELERLNADDILVYSDAGRSRYYGLRQFPSRLVARARASGFLLGPTIGQHGPMSRWTKRDAFVLMDMDRPEIYARMPIQATWSLWTPARAALAFLEDWIAACRDPRILTDMPNTQGLPDLPDFRNHRHDQAVLSLLAFRDGAPHLDYQGQPVERILRLRPQSRLAHLFLKRIDDAEAVERGELISALMRGWNDLREAK